MVLRNKGRVEMEIRAYISSISSVKLKSEVESLVNIMFDISLLTNNGLDTLDLCVSFDRDGNIVNFPSLAKPSNDKSYSVYLKRGKAISKILKFEGGEAKTMCEKAFLVLDDLNSSLEKLCLLDNNDFEFEKRKLLNDANYKIQKIETFLN